MIEWFHGLGRGARTGIVAGGALLLVVAAFGIWLFAFFQHDDPEEYADDVQHFLYGSIGSEAAGGIPYWIWRVLPTVFADHLPEGPGEGYERFGLIYEEGKDRPIGTSLRDRPFPMIAFNCAACHVGTVRDSEGATPRLVLGMPAQQLDFLAYQRFLIAAAEDEDFGGEHIIDAIKDINPDLGLFEEMAYRFIVIPRMKDEILGRAEEFDFLNDRPEWGPGRVDTFSPYKVHFGVDMLADDTIGTADLPSLWNQAVRDGMYLHWDANNNSLSERNISAALGAGATEDSLDFPSIERVATWIRSLPAPEFPPDRIDAELAEAGRALYTQHCAACHALGGERVGQLEPIENVRTDPERTDAFNDQIAELMNTYGGDRDWGFENFRATDGYANSPLDGIWLRAPYLHNGSVPTLYDLLLPADERPTQFYRGSDIYDYQDLGFVSSGAQAEADGFLYDTTLRGNGNGGHEYGTSLTEQERRALLEYLKTQ
ncbi:MAG: cytochrome c [Dehalococcoidia bacterium]|nr:cytochrome c [Dehalococcoidia bacterium]